VNDKSHLIGCTLDKCELRKDLGVIIVAIKRASGDMEFNPTSMSEIKQGDTLIALGEKKHLRTISEMVGKN
jgi:voltage-gated potassium channel